MSEYVGWSQERENELRRLWTEGLTASAIAAKLGHVTRNAVIGKSVRMKLERRKSSVTVARCYNPGASDSLKSAREKKATFRPVSDIHKLFKATPFKSAAEIAIPEGQAVTLIELEPHHCRWPLGRHCDPTTHFCGAHKMKGTSYCQDHARIAFAPSAPRRQPQGQSVAVKTNEKEFA